MKKPQYPSEKLDQYMLRFPDGMRDELKDLAARSGRSLNAEIVLRLKDSMELDRLAGEPLDGYLVRIYPDLADKIASAAKRMNRTIDAQAIDTLEKSYLPPKA